MEFKEGEIIRLPEKREVLFEKYSKQIVIEAFFYEKLNGCEIRFSEEYPSYIFFVKKDKCLFEIYNFDKERRKQESKNGYFNVKYDEIWSVFETRFELDYQQIQVFIQGEVEKLLKLDGLTPARDLFHWIT